MEKGFRPLPNCPQNLSQKQSARCFRKLSRDQRTEGQSNPKAVVRRHIQNQQAGTNAKEQAVIKASAPGVQGNRTGKEY